MDIEKIIQIKENNKKLSQEQIDFMVSGFINGSISKQDMSRFLIAIYNNSLCKKETYYLFDSMLNQSSVLNLDQLGPTIDKHSTGGVSDSTSILLVPLYALFGFKCLKMSGGALGHTGGTADKILLFEGLKNEISIESAISLTKQNGGCFIASNQELAIADKKIYALRNEIDAVMSIPLIATSIMSKKVACGAKNIVLDVKYGNGALMKDKKDAIKLGKLMKYLGGCYGRNVSIVYGDMNQPLGEFVGDYVEVLEVIDLLKNPKSSRLLNHTLKLLSKGVYKQLGKSEKEIIMQAKKMIEDKTALNKLKEIISSQGGSLKLFDESLPVPKYLIKSNMEGVLNFINCEKLGNLDHKLKNQKGYLGFKISKSLQDKVVNGDVLFEIYCKCDIDINQNEFISCLEIKDEIGNWM